MEKIKTIDLFCGAGGFTTGFEKAGYDVIFANDNWGPAVETYKYNHKKTKISSKDIRKLTADEIREVSGSEKIDIIIGGPPCQGFSFAGKRKYSDKRNFLWKEFFRIVSDLQPYVIVMENVQGILHARDKKGTLIVDKIKNSFDDIDYKLAAHQLNAADYGVPQSRMRTIMIANSLGLENGILFPKPNYGKGVRKYVTVGQTIMNISMREDKNDEWNHRRMNHTTQLIRKLKKIPEGKRMEKENYSFVYRRLHRKRPSVTLVPGHSAFPVHPTQHRSITVREAARLQTFPDSYRFFGLHWQQCLLVGNAVPPRLAEAIARNIKKAVIRSRA